jgi:hypothetical protein
VILVDLSRLKTGRPPSPGYPLLLGGMKGNGSLFSRPTSGTPEGVSHQPVVPTLALADEGQKVSGKLSFACSRLPGDPAPPTLLARGRHEAPPRPTKAGMAPVMPH